MKLQKSVVVFDLETTAKEVYKAEIVEFAGIKINTDGSREELEFLCKPSNPIPQEAIDIHGISNEDVSKMPPFKKFVKPIQKFFKDSHIAGFNINRYDMKILERQMKECGVDDFFKDKVVYDAYPIFCHHQSRKLANAVKFYTGEDAVDTHEAMGDVKSTLSVIEKQIEMEKLTFEEVASKSVKDSKEREARDKENPLERFIVFDIKNKPIVNFTKHKGKYLQDMDSGFIKWMLGQDWIPKEVKKYIKNFNPNKKEKVI